MGPTIEGGWIEFRPDNRGVVVAAVCSLVFHGALLASWHGLIKPAVKPAASPGPIVARLAAPAARPAGAPEAAPPQPEPPKPKAEEPPPPPPVAKPAPAPTPTPVAKPAPVAKSAPTVPAAPTAAPAPSAAPSSESTASPSSAPSAPSAPVAKAEPGGGSPTAAPAAPSADADPGTLRQYQLAIITTARKYKRYPRAAMDNNWEGKVEVRMVIGANGMIVSMSIKTSTGHELLDKTALDMITKAKPLTPIPPSLRGKEFTVDVPVVFSLKEDAPSGG